MNGLLDFLKAPAGQGLLSAGFGYMAGANSRTPVQNLGRAGLAGVLGYNGAMSSEAERQKGQLAAQAEQRKQDALAQLSPEDRLAVNAGVPYQDIWSRRNVAPQYVEGFDAQGRRVKGWATPQGFTQVGGAESKPLNWQDRGGTLVALDPYTGLPMQGVAPAAKTMTAGERDASARGWAGVNIQRHQLEQGKTQILNDPNQGPILVNKVTGVSAPVLGVDGSPVLSEATAKQVSGSKKALSIIDQAETLIDSATGSYIGAGVDQAYRAFGGTTKGSEATAKLKALEGSLMMAQPRMEGPQSNMDVQLYRQMAGQIGDPTVPASMKKAALTTIRQLHERYSGAQPATNSASNNSGASVSNW